MNWRMWLPFLANVVLAVAGPRLARVLPPRVAVRLLATALLAARSRTN